jgi:hypothetical protein
MGLIGPHWARGWVIEDNIIHDAKCSGISLGKERGSGENEWTRLRVKHGTQRERDVIFRALRLGWSKETVGGHLVRNNTIYDCGQTGVCGHLGAVFSTLTGNHIYRIHPKALFTGHEMAGIKIHAAIDTLISGNHIHHCTQGLWMDWQAQGLRITGNLLYENRWNDLHVEVSHGPYVVDNNLFLSPLNLKNISQGGTYAHNLFGGQILGRSVPGRFTPYHFPHSTQVAGVMTILCGDDRFYNNLFAPVDPEREAEAQIVRTFDAAAERRSVGPRQPVWGAQSFGLALYDEFPLTTDEWDLGRTPHSYAVQKLPVRVASNLYYGEASPFAREQNHASRPDHQVDLRLEEREGALLLRLTLDESPDSMDCPWITTELLGTAFQAEAPFENPDATALRIDTDYHGHQREGSPTVGPFQKTVVGEQSVLVWRGRD